MKRNLEKSYVDPKTDAKEGDIIIYEASDGQLSFNVNLFDETVWLTQEQMAELFGKARSTIAEHINNVFREGELIEEVTCRNFRQVTQHGAIKGRERVIEIKYYNLDMIISVGYRVKSQRGVQFRQWATGILKQYMLNGYAVNETRIRHIESVMDELVSSQKILREDVDRIENLLIKLIERPIIINNHNYNQHKITLENHKLEDKIITLLDSIIHDIKDNKKVKKQVENVKSNISNLSNNPKFKNPILRFFKEIGDDKSEICKTIKGAKISKDIISELIKLGAKLKEII